MFKSDPTVSYEKKLCLRCRRSLQRGLRPGKRDLTHLLAPQASLQSVSVDRLWEIWSCCHSICCEAALLDVSDGGV